MNTAQFAAAVNADIRRMVGPGDSATWPAYSGRPNDPRAPDDNDLAVLWSLMSRREKQSWLTENMTADELADHLLEATDEAMP